MNNQEKFRKMFLEFEKETKKKVKITRNNGKDKTLGECIDELKMKHINPYYNKDSFIYFCRNLRNINSHNMNDNYYTITDETLSRFGEILQEAKYPFKVNQKATLDIYSKTLSDKVKDTMLEMNKKNYTHIPIYSENNKQLVGIFSENTLFQYLLEDEIIEISNNTTFNDIRNCIDLAKSKEIVKFVSKNELYDNVVNDFILEFKKKQKLSCVMVTDSGKPTEKVIGIITAWDVIAR